LRRDHRRASVQCRERICRFEISRAPKDCNSSSVFRPASASSDSIASLTIATLRCREAIPVRRISRNIPSLRQRPRSPHRPAAVQPRRQRADCRRRRASVFEKLPAGNSEHGSAWAGIDHWGSCRSSRQPLRDDPRSGRSAKRQCGGNRSNSTSPSGGNRRLKPRARPASICRTDQALDVGKNSFGSGNVELASRQHEIHLRVHFPENSFLQRIGLAPRGLQTILPQSC